jgi:hypothetical protein
MKPTRHIAAARQKPIPLKKLVPNVKIVTDPKKLASLKAEAARLRRMEISVRGIETNAVR